MMGDHGISTDQISLNDVIWFKPISLGAMNLQIQWRQVRLPLIHAFTIAHGTSDFRINTIVSIQHQGITGFGLAAPNPRYGETPTTTDQALHRIAMMLPENPLAIRSIMHKVNQHIEGAYAAKAAVDMALHDWLGKSLDAPLHYIWGIDATQIAPTSMTIGVDTPEKVQKKVREVPQFKVLKIKLNGERDRELIQAIRDVTDQPLRVDANEGWRDKTTALKEIEWLATQGVELIEQPMKAKFWGEHAWLKERSPLPLIADEALDGQGDMTALANAYHGINIKLMKCGGLLPAMDLISQARAFGMSMMLGCMVESSLGIAAAAQIAPLVDYVDLDGHLLIRDDPFLGPRLEKGRLQVPQRPGLGALERLAH